MVLKNRNRNKNNIFKRINYPIILLTIISALFIGSFIYQVTSKTNDNIPDYRPDLSKLLMENKYEKNTGHRIQIEIKNGCGENKLAQIYRLFLKEEGFDVIDIDDADSHDYNFTNIIYHRDNKDMGDYISKILGVSDSLIIDNLNKNLGFDLTVIIGKDYNQLSSYKKAILYSLEINR